MVPPPAPSITEFNTLTWRQTKAFAQARIAALRELNDTPGMTEAQTEGIRGEIKAWKQLLEQEKRKPEVPHRDIYN